MILLLMIAVVTSVAGILLAIHAGMRHLEAKALWARLEVVKFCQAYRVGPLDFGFRAASIQAALKRGDLIAAEWALSKLERAVGLTGQP